LHEDLPGVFRAGRSDRRNLPAPLGADLLAGLRARLREHLRLARLFADWVDADPGFERVAPVPFSVVCFRTVPRAVGDGAAPDALNERLLELAAALRRA
jgi:glutamate/tyrosine decarboxylase-like PLP-dependent enzyme